MTARHRELVHQFRRHRDTIHLLELLLLLRLLLILLILRLLRLILLVLASTHAISSVPKLSGMEAALRVELINGRLRLKHWLILFVLSDKPDMRPNEERNANRYLLWLLELNLLHTEGLLQWRGLLLIALSLLHIRVRWRRLILHFHRLDTVQLGETADQRTEDDLEWRGGRRSYLTTCPGISA